MRFTNGGNNFLRFLGDSIEDIPNGFNMPTDVREDEYNYYLEIDVPGFEKENISINFENNCLLIEAKREVNKEENMDSYIKQERFLGTCKRKYFFNNLDFENIKAKYDNGVLKIEAPKISKPTGKRIVIE